ncbi:nitrate- and nitrite sensing domain-containing protein [Saccharopolyspora taberi]|uniref:histidine kinase n=1 Tax=Saccharopolyspora taberi TaxID=60895 RepID=A0ABN3VBS0_9PSEU
MSSGFDSSPVDAHRAPAWSRAARGIVQWRNWRLAFKLAAVVLVPVITAVTLGVMQIREQIEHAAGYTEMDRVVAAAGSVRSSVDMLQDERTAAAEFLADGPVRPQQLQDRFTASDRAMQHHVAVLRENLADNVVVRLARQDAERKVGELPLLREQILGTHVDPGVAVNSYTEIISVLLGLDRTLISQVSSAQLTSTAISVHELAKIGEEMRLQQAVVLMGLTRGSLNTREIALLDASETRRAAALREFRATASPRERLDYDRMYLRPETTARETTLRLAMTERKPGESELSSALVTPPAWQAQSARALDALVAIQTRLENRLHDTAFSLQDIASNLAGLESVILLSTLLIAGAVAALVARQLLGSLALLRRSALETANVRLPQAVSDIRAGHGERTPIERVPVDTTEEIGQVGRAFDAVHSQAVSLASEQAELRHHYSDSFINVSRRSQSLLERQLRLFEQLERDEEDPDQLATLFQLDHLSTRMRRNNENLMVLAGSDLARRFTQPASPADLARAAVSEIEHYPRVLVEPLPDVRIVGYAASDLVRLLAELLDNAANFSAPQTSVVVSGHRPGDGSLGIDVVDQGIGMKPEALAAANERLASDGEIELSTSRRMGLFVVGRLAARHGIRVELHPGPEGTGLRAHVGVGAELLVETAPAAARINGVADSDVPLPTARIEEPPTQRRPIPGSEEETLVQAFDWAAAEQDAASPGQRNGFGPAVPQRPSGNNGVPQHQAPQHQEALQRPEATQYNEATQHHEIPQYNGTPQHNGVPRHNGTPQYNGHHNGAPTPIFDDLASAWFQVSQPPDRGTANGGSVRWPARPAGPGQDWSFANDQERRRAEEVAANEPADYTSVGLPVRVPRAHLVAGSAAGGETPRLQRDPNVARGRLASFQHGLHRGRHRQNGAPPVLGPEPPAAPPVAPEPAPPVEEPADYTSAGLPRRSPRSQLVAGVANDPAATPPRDADLMRGRLTSFQRGVREGKHTLREDAADDHR